LHTKKKKEGRREKKKDKMGRTNKRCALPRKRLRKGAKLRIPVKTKLQD